MGSTFVFFVSTVTATSSKQGIIYDFNMCAAAWSALALDAIRMPRFMVLCTVSVLQVAGLRCSISEAPGR